MGLNKKAMMKVALALFLVAVTATVEARLDPNTLLARAIINGEPNYTIKSTTTACCDNCSCTKSDPPQCMCNDLGDTCHSACKFCICANRFPRVCNCLDVNTFCYEPCSSATKSH